MVKVQVPKSTASKTKNSKNDSDSSGVVRIAKKPQQDSDSSDSPIVKKQKPTKKFSNDSSSEEQEKVLPASKALKFNKKPVISEEDPKKAKKTQKKFEDSSDESDQKKPKNKKKIAKVSSSEESDVKKKTQKAKTTKKAESSSDDAKKKPKKKLKKVETSSSEEPVVKAKSKVVEKKKKVESSSSEEKPVLKKKVISDSDSDDNKRKKPAKKQKKIESSESSDEKPKKKAKVPEPDSSDSDQSDSEEEELALKSKEKKEKTEVKPVTKKSAEIELPQKRKASDLEQKPKPVEAQSFTNNRETELFVGGLAYEATEDDLNTLFSKHGEIEAISIPQNNGTPKGIAFISFVNAQSATAALVLNNTEYMGRILRVNFSSQKPDRKPFQASAPGSTVFVGNLPYSVTEETIREFFNGCGEIKQVRISKTPEGEIKGFGHVEFFDRDSAANAIKLAGNSLDGRQLKIDFAADKPQGGQGGPRQPQRFNNPAPSASFQGKKVKL